MFLGCKGTKFSTNRQMFLAKLLNHPHKFADDSEILCSTRSCPRVFKVQKISQITNFLCDFLIPN